MSKKRHLERPLCHVVPSLILNDLRHLRAVPHVGSIARSAFQHKEKIPSTTEDRGRASTRRSPLASPRSAGIVSCNARARPLPRPGCLKKNAHLYERHARDPQARLHAPLAPGNVPDRAQEMRTLRRRLHLATSSAQKHEERKSQAYRPEEI